MNLNDLATEQRGLWSRSVAPVRDIAGEETHRLTVEGPTELVREVLGGADFDLEIDPGLTREGWESRLAERLQAQARTPSDPDEAERLIGLFKEPPGRATPHDALVISVDRLHPGGTGYLLTFPLVVPRGANLFFTLPQVCVCAGTVFPASGDPDLFLTLNGLGPPTVAASTLAGTAVDSVSFATLLCIPFFGFVPVLRLSGFTTSTCVLVWSGFGLP